MPESRLIQSPVKKLFNAQFTQQTMTWIHIQHRAHQVTPSMALVPKEVHGFPSFFLINWVACQPAQSSPFQNLIGFTFPVFLCPSYHCATASCTSVLLPFQMRQKATLQIDLSSQDSVKFFNRISNSRIWYTAGTVECWQKAIGQLCGHLQQLAIVPFHSIVPILPGFHQ